MNIKPSEKSEFGFSLIELLIVIVVIGIVCAVVIPRAFFSTPDSHGAEQFLNDLRSRLLERSSSVKRLNGNVARNAFDGATSPIEFDLDAPETTASLVTDGDDANKDGVDDYTGQKITTLSPDKDDPTRSVWNLSFRNDALQIPKEWRLARSADELGKIPVIANGARGRGIPVTRIAFDGDGRALWRDDSGIFQDKPTGTVAGKKATESAFWVFYFVCPGASVAVAVAVHPASGFIELFHYDGGTWRGFADRVPTNK